MNTNPDTPKPKIKHSLRIVRHVVPVNEPTVPAVPKQERFRRISQTVTNRLGSPTAFAAAVLVVVLWGASGPVFGFSDTWQLVINTATTIVTFLMVFAIQNSQNRDSRAMQLKLNELINANRGARTEFVDLEDLSDTELDSLQGQFREIHDQFIERQAEDDKKK